METIINVRKRSVVSALVALITILILAGCTSLPSGGEATPTPSTSASTASGFTPEQIEAIRKELTVSTISEDAACTTDANGLVPWDIGALKTVPDPRKWSDAISTPFTSTDPAGVRKELQQSICADALVGESWATFDATDVRDKLLSLTGIDLLVENPWLQDATDISKVNERAASYMPLLDVKPANATDDQIKSAWEKNRAWQDRAAKINTLLDRFAAVGIDARQSVVNYHLSNGGMVAGGLPSVERNPNPEGLPALILSLTQKDQCKDLLTIGVNLADKRPELFESPDCASPTPAEQPGTPSGGDTPETPQDCASHFGEGWTGPGWVDGRWICKDPATDDPNSQGHNRPGGGGQAPAQQDAVQTAPSEQAPPVYQAPSAPAAPAPSGGGGQEATPDPAPAPSPEPQPSPSSPATGVSCGPGMKESNGSCVPG